MKRTIRGIEGEFEGGSSNRGLESHETRTIHGHPSIFTARNLSIDKYSKPHSSPSHVESHSQKATISDKSLSLKSTAWASPGAAEYDFRSDVITTPTLSMLSAIINTTLRDDVFMEDSTTTSLENFIAELTGHEAAMFVITGTMANQLALRTHLTQPPHAILTDAQAHVVRWEAGGIASASGALLQAVMPSNSIYLTLEDITSHAEVSDDVHKCPTRVISLENTVGGSIYPLSELRRISEWARNQNPPIKTHLDGARLWEAIAAGAGSLRDYAELFDSLSLDFSKNLGAPMGAIVISSSNFIKQARRIRKSVGGGMRQAGVLSAACRVAVDETFGPGIWGFKDGGKLRQTHEMAKKVGDIWISLGGTLERKVETNIIWLNLKDIGISNAQLNEAGRRHGVSLDGKRVCLHHQISVESVSRLTLAFNDVLSHKAKL